jgi:hypothetical protein
MRPVCRHEAQWPTWPSWPVIPNGYKPTIMMQPASPPTNLSRRRCRGYISPRRLTGTLAPSPPHSPRPAQPRVRATQMRGTAAPLRLRPPLVLTSPATPSSPSPATSSSPSLATTCEPSLTRSTPAAGHLFSPRNCQIYAGGHLLCTSAGQIYVTRYRLCSVADQIYVGGHR